MENISKHYHPKDTELKWLKFWEKNKVYKFNPREKGNVFSIDTPPPTVSGRMHIGHAYSYTHEDFVARYRRIKGENVFFPFGTDDNGLATERLVEKLKKVRASKMKRNEFINLCNKTLKEITPEFIQDWKNIGMSCDFFKTYSTIDDSSRKISQSFFIDLFNKKLVYRQEAPVVWCPRCQTAIAQAEMEDKEQETYFNNLVFKLENRKSLIISTTRPELLSSCVTIFVHPSDKRYKSLVGKKAQVPIFNHWVEIKTDKKVDMKKGSGAVMCCTFGDKTDVEWFKKYNLPLVVSITKDGLMTKRAKDYAGLSIKEARGKIIEDLKKKKLLASQKKIIHTVNVHERCKTEVEILNTTQWFIKYLNQKKKFIELGRKLKWHPAFMRSRYNNWIDGLGWDWCVSRQRFFGVPFPIWYCKKCGEVKLARSQDLPVDPLTDKPKGKCEKCGGREFEPERDVLDTWATSSLTPQLALYLFFGKKKGDELIPMNLRPQAHDIISTWLFYTVARSYFHSKRLPWKNVAISGHVLDSSGRKMSKSLGNAVAPQDILEKYGADALRFWAAGRSLGQDINYSEEEIQAGQKFLTKLWNVNRFVMLNANGRECKKRMNANKIYQVDRWILAELQELIKKTTKAFENYEYSAVKIEIEKFFWIKLADNYIEIVKNRLYNKSKDGKLGRESAQFTLYNVLFTLIRLLSPVTPFITEEIYQAFFKTGLCAKSVHLCNWPEVDKKLKSGRLIEVGKVLIEIISVIRRYKAVRGLSLKAELGELIIDCSAKDKRELSKMVSDIKAVGNIRDIKFRRIKKGGYKNKSLNLKVSLQ